MTDEPLILDHQRKNLAKLGKFLATQVQDDMIIVDGIERVFDMERYCFDTGIYSGKDMLDCGAAGCAIGFGPFAGIPKKLDESFLHYSERCFVSNPSIKGDILYSFLFSDEWKARDNTALGAAKRIAYVLEGCEISGEVDDTFFDPDFYQDADLGIFDKILQP